MMKRIMTVVALCGFAGSAFAQAPAPTDNKDMKPAVVQPTLVKGKTTKKVFKKARKMKKMATKHNAAANPASAPAPAPAASAPATK